MTDPTPAEAIEEMRRRLHERQPDAVLERVARELKTIRELLAQVTISLTSAESEVPERMRRFVIYMHCIHDISWMYEERGQPVPQYLLREMERCDDRYRQLLNELHLDGGTFEKVRREMAKDPENRWDHTRLLLKPEGVPDETGKSNSQQHGVD